MASAVRVLLTDHPWPETDIEVETLQQAGIELVDAPDGSAETLARLAVDCDAILTCWAKVTREVIDAAPRLKYVGRLGIGLDNIDVSRCTERGIPVTNVPAYCVDEVAEHALALFLALARRVSFYHLRTKQGEYSLPAAPMPRRVAGQKLGIVGFGKIGRAVAQRAAGLGLELLVWNRSPVSSFPTVRQVDRETLLSESDWITLHLPLAPETKHWINADALRMMKQDALLVNTSRGGLIDARALQTVLAEGKLAGVGLDVQDPEPPDLSEPLYRHERVIVTPHSAFTSVESLIDLRTTATKQVLDALSGRTPDNVVNGVRIG